MNAEILSIGTELLLGQIVDTNASYLAQRLPELGIDLYWITQVGDNQGRLVEALKRAWDRSQLILTTGGLGPTQDDVTREAIAEMLSEEMMVDPTLEWELREFFARRSYQMPQSNIKQATTIPSARPIPNPRGTAPGWWVEQEGRRLIAMPGPPAEMQRMWEKEVSPRLRESYSGGIILSRTLKTLGLAEAAVDEMVSRLLSSPNPTLAVYSKPDGIHLRITAKAQDHPQAEAMIAKMEEEVGNILGDALWGVDEDTLEGIVGRLLLTKGLSLATMESCTGGLLANTITDIPGSSAYFKGGLVAYTNEMKVAWGVEPELIAQYGAVSPHVAEAMAQCARRRLGADIGIGITGVAGPDELEGKPAGTVHIAADDGNQRKVLSAAFPPLRLDVKRRATMTALWELRRLLLSRK